jgi:hypothetical protein
MSLQNEMIIRCHMSLRSYVGKADRSRERKTPCQNFHLELCLFKKNILKQLENFFFFFFFVCQKKKPLKYNFLKQSGKSTKLKINNLICENSDKILHKIFSSNRNIY